MRFLVTEKLGSHKFKTPEGYLICTDAILSRTGKQEYKRCELFGDTCEDPDKIVNVERTDDEVFSDKAMASFENKAVCIEHPDHDVNAENHNELAVGFVRDIHKGEDNGKPVMMGTLVITDKDAVEAVESGEYKELSCGYDCDIDDDGEPCQRNIRGNHVALCKQGRAGIARIVDSKVKDMAKLSADESATLKAMIEGGAGKRLYERLSYNKPVTIHLTQEDKELLRWHRDENPYLTNEEKALLKKLVGDGKVSDTPDLSGLYKNDDGDAIKVTRNGFSYDVRFGEDTIFNKGWSFSRSYDSIHLLKYLRQNRFTKVSKFDYLKDSEMKDIQSTKTPGTDKIIYVMQSDIDKNLYFYIGKTFSMKEGDWGYTKFEMGNTTPDELKSELARNGWHQVVSGPARIIDASNEEWTVVEEENYKKANKPIGANDADVYDGQHEIVVNGKKYKPYYVESGLRNIILQSSGTYFVMPHDIYSKYVDTGIDISKYIILQTKSKSEALKIGLNTKDSLDMSNKEQLFTIKYEQDGVMYIRKVRANSIEDAISKVKDNGHKVVVFTNQVLNELGKNNSIGKYDRVVQAMRSLYSESLLPDNELKILIRKKVPEYIKKYVKE